MQILAMYLPQFHRFKENDQWWGEGFTEWTNTKKAMPLYKGHYQPKEPLGDNYYNLLDDEAKVWQANLANQYGIDGFVYYHYWFKGKKLMEKPAEQMIKNRNININFCFSWANEPWTRSWDGCNKSILMPQEYGDEKDWISHFEYLLQFFKDKRYIKIENKPVLFIYRVNSIINHEKMFECWINLAKQNGFDGLYIVETLNSFQKNPISDYSSAAYIFEPMYTLENEYRTINHLIHLKRILPSIFKGFHYIKVKDYNTIWKFILKRNNNYKGKKTFLGCFPNWDNTSRRGKKSIVINETALDKFEKNFEKLVLKAKKESNDFIIINAWNEWAEGAYLEPDKKNKYGYLDAIRKVRNKLNV